MARRAHYYNPQLQPEFLIVTIVTLRSLANKTKFNFNGREFVIFIKKNLAYVGLNVDKVDDQSARKAVNMVASIDEPVLKKFAFFT